MDFKSIREQFAITNKTLKRNGKEIPLIYLDHGASTHPPKQVLDRFILFMQSEYANVHRGEHELSKISSQLFEDTPKHIAKLFGITNLDNSGKQVVFGSNTTSVLDIALHQFRHMPGKILTTVMEHHSNFLPSQRYSDVEFIEVDDHGMIQYDQLEDRIQKQDIKVVSISGGSNVTGYMPDVHRIARLAHENNAKVIVDAAQRTAHSKLDIKPLDHPEHLDYVAIGGHKMYAPFGSSALIGTTKMMDASPPYIPGGGTVSFVSTQESTFLSGPDRHQPGTPNIGGTIAMGEAAQFLMQIGMDKIRKHELELLSYTLNRLEEFEEFSLLGNIPIKEKLGVMSFNIGNHSHHKISHLLDDISGIATRNGCFCAQPYVQRLLDISDNNMKNYREQYEAGKIDYLPGAVRATIGVYNTKEEMEIFVNTIETICKENLIKA